SILYYVSHRLGLLEQGFTSTYELVKLELTPKFWFGSTSDLPGIYIEKRELKHCPHYHMPTPSHGPTFSKMRQDM
ncbi:unnamed protein product, partial [Leptidea sinapis]